MSRYPLLRSLVSMLLVFLTQPLLAQDQLGVFFDAQGTESTITTTTAYSRVSAWIQLVDPSVSEALTAYEFRLEVHSDGPDPILAWTLPEQALNIAAAPAFMVGLGTPLSIGPRVTLAEVSIIVPEAGQTVWLTLHPLEEPSLLDPPEYGYPVCHPVYAIGSDGEMFTMSVLTGCESEPVASINPSGNPPEIKIAGLPPSITLQKDAQGKQIEYITLRNAGDVSFSGQAYVTGDTPIQFQLDEHYYTNGPVDFQVPVNGSTRITPYYEGGGSVDATIELDICGQRWSVPVGSPTAGVDCAWSVDSLDFGEVDIGERKELLVGITNTGYEFLPLESLITVPHFTLLKTSHPSDILAIGESCNYRVIFEPYAVGDHSASVNAGSMACSLELIGTCLDGPPTCELDASSLVFSDFIIGANTANKTITILNSGGGTLEGNVTLNDNSGAFGLGYSSAGYFALGNNESKTITVTFTPLEEGPFAAEVDFGLECGAIPVSGEAIIVPPQCSLNIPALEFGRFVIGTNFQSKYFRITNTGGGILEGSVALDDANGVFRLVNNVSGPFQLGPNETLTISVYFEPEEEGLYTGTVDLGLECGSVPLSGEAVVLPPQCLVDHSSWDFGEFIVGANRQYKYFHIRNIGGGILEGSIALNNATGAFELSNGGPFYLAANASTYVGVFFDPLNEGVHSAEITLGLECESISLTGNAIEVAPECQVSTTTLYFGETVVGQSPPSRYFRIQNVGGGLLEGSITLTDTTGVFSLRNADDSSYSLPHDYSGYYYVYFSAPAAGQYTAHLDLGGDCGSILISGRAVELPPACEVSPAELDFDDQIVGGYGQSKYFTVKNTGGGLLEGSVAIAGTSTGFELSSWSGPSYSLTYMQYKRYTIKFNPLAAGDFSTVLELGADCGSIPVSGSGLELDPECELMGSSLNEGVLTIRSVPVGGYRIGYIAVKNIGGGSLDGQMTFDELDGPFHIIDSGTYSLHNEQYTFVQIKFTPQEVGMASTVLHTGSLCEDVIVESIGEESYAACNSYMYHTNFDRVSVGERAVAYIYIYNTGYMDMEGDLQVDGEGFQLENPGPFTLAVGERRYEEFWFTPETVGDFSAVVSTGLPLCSGDWNVEGNSVPANSDQMGFYFDSEGIDNTLETNFPKIRKDAYLVLHNPSADGQLIHWYVNFWSYGSAMVMDDWTSNLPGNFVESSYSKRLYLESPIPYSETMVLAEFTVLVPDPNEACEVNIGFAYYQNMTDTGIEYFAIREPVNLVINTSKSELKKLPATPVARLDDQKVILEWPCTPMDFEGFHVYRRMNDEEAERLTEEPLAFTEGEGRFEDSNLPEDAFELHYFVTSLFKGVESDPGLEVTLELLEQETEIPVPTQTRLLAIYPNPFNPETNISFDIAKPTRVQIKIYDVSGRLVRNLTDQSFDAGHFEETWNGRDDAGRTLPSNVYYARMVADSVVQMRKMTLLK